MIVYLNGKFVPAKEAKLTIFDPGFMYGDGIFETLRTYKGKIILLDEHIDRLKESAKMRGWRLTWSRKELTEIISKTLAKNTYEEARVRITITPGIKEATIFVWVQPLEKVSENAYKRGVSVITFPLERPFPQMKTTSMQPLLIAREEMRKKRAFEALLINSRGHITEGTWTNFFIVKDKFVFTPRMGVLLGTTRELVLNLAKSLLHIRQKDVTLKDLMAADECFLTNSTKGIVPIVKVDGKKIGRGTRGPVTKHLMRVFEEKLFGSKGRVRKESSKNAPKR